MAKRHNNTGETDSRSEEAIVNVVESKATLQDKFEKNRGMVLGLIAGLFLLVGCFIIYKYVIKDPKEQQAKAAIYKAEQQFAQDSFALALENPGGGFEGLLDVISNYSGTKTANLAKLYAGVSYLNLGRYDEAISHLNSHSAGGSFSPIIKNGNLGDAYSEKGDFGQAISFYSKAASAGNDDLLTPYYLYKLGLLSKRNGDNGKALTSFNRIKTDFPDSEEATKIASLISAVSK